MSENTDIVFEIFNDAFWIGYILEIKRQIKDYAIKESLSPFIIFLSSIFCEETINAHYGGIVNENITKKDIADLRMFNLKFTHNLNSEKTQEIISEMGISFNEYVFDIYLLMHGDKLLDINFRNWHLNKEEDFELLDGIASTPYRWIEILIPNFYDLIEKSTTEYMHNVIDRLDSCNINRKSYSCYSLFKFSNLKEDEKLYIMQRYGLVKTILLIESAFSGMISINFEKFSINMQHFFIKVKSIILEIVWHDYSIHKLGVLKNIFNKNKGDIPDDFYPLNRKLRDNLHYKKFNKLTEKEYAYLETYQKYIFSKHFK